jgi:streptogramin lyase
MPSVPQFAQAQVVTPKIAIITGSTAAELATNVNTQTNTLNKALRVPAAGQTSGDVLNDSIKVLPIATAVNNNISTYQAAVTWSQWVTPS